MNIINSIESNNFFTLSGPVPFTGSIRFITGTNRYVLSGLNNTAANLSTGNYTIEFWVNLNTPTPLPAGTFIDGLSYNGVPILTYYPSTNVVGGWGITYSSSQGVAFTSGVNSLTSIDTTPNANIQTCSWVHIAFTRDSTAKRLDAYVNGTRTQTLTYTANNSDYNVTNGYLMIGRLNNFTAVGDATQQTVGCEISGIRISNNIRYTGTSFTVPTTKFVSDANTRVLFNFNDVSTYLQGVSGATGTVAVTMTLPTTSPGVEWSSTHYPPEIPSNLLPLTGSAQFVPASTTAQLNSGNWNSKIQGIPFTSNEFTIEMWIKTPNASTYNQCFFGYGATSNNFALVVGLNGISGNQSKISFANFTSTVGTGTDIVTSNTTIATNTWHHVAVTRNASDVVRIFIDGVIQTATATNSASLLNLNFWSLGRRQAATDANGVPSGFKIAGLRISSIDRYNATSFTPSKTQINQFKTYNTSNLNYIYTCNFSDVNNVTLINGANVPLVISGYSSNTGASVYSTDVPT